VRKFDNGFKARYPSVTIARMDIRAGQCIMPAKSAGRCVPVAYHTRRRCASAAQYKSSRRCGVRFAHLIIGWGLPQNSGGGPEPLQPSGAVAPLHSDNLMAVTIFQTSTKGEEVCYLSRFRAPSLKGILYLKSFRVHLPALWSGATAPDGGVRGGNIPLNCHQNSRFILHCGTMSQNAIVNRRGN